MKDITVSHGEPIIRFSFSGSNESRAYTDIGLTRSEIEDEFIVSKKGKQELFIKLEKIDESPLDIEPIEIQVNLIKPWWTLYLKMLRRSLSATEKKVSSSSCLCVLHAIYWH
ncbi:hypothetical protein [Paenibacillus sp. PL91]|uniref:hypothetical protein n=1 Tax=Paenibacillus sp. PL91 TaxID=2729538 RepID=UPI00145E8D74|nr:hypothetical protein [Paenibacillus sp. PL91]MBC9202968.1 hypothetical protein [Paenibacillus sp. PL91]